jgi:hypothetical protein
MWTKNALSLIIAQAESTWRDLLLTRLREWIKLTQLMYDKRKDVGRTWSKRLILESFNLECCAYPLDGHILINFKYHTLEESFAVLERWSLTVQKIQVLNYPGWGILINRYQTP